MRKLSLFALIALLAAAALQPATAAPPAPARSPDWDAPHVSGELIAQLPPGGRAALERSGTQVLRELPELGLAVVRAPRGRTLPEAAASLAQEGAEWVEPNYTFELDHVPNDPDYSIQAAYLDRIGASEAWDTTKGRSDIVVAILDTGVYTGHVDLRDGIWRNPGEIPGNGIDDEGNGFVDDAQGWDFADNENEVLDDYGHGTHVAGIAAARIDNAIGIAGVAGQATIMPVDVFSGGIGTYEDLIRAIVYATDNGAHVINMSLGASSYSRGEEAAVNYAYERGAVVVAAAGNGGRTELHYPAAHPNAIAVAATDANDVVAGFSTRGAFVDVAAPGVSIYSTMPTDIDPDGYRLMSGTSMATPHVSGLAALILSRNPTLTPKEVRAFIEGTAYNLGAPGRDDASGYGRISAGQALAAVAQSDGPVRSHVPGTVWDLDFAGCVNLVENGGFEDGLSFWQGQGAVALDAEVHSDGATSVHFPGGASARGVLTQTLVVPPNAHAGIISFAYRIDREDYGRGTTPEWPFDDWFTVELRAPDGAVLAQLLRTGNTADTSNAGLEWDEYLYRMTAGEVAALRDAREVMLVLTAQNDADASPTDVWADSARICLTTAADGPAYLPVLVTGF
ncbi:MAG: S8 family serine peptidase [Anaerolineae bacterium]|nr:S8 family serine peptidase [Anaerolineae bacterium]